MSIRAISYNYIFHLPGFIFTVMTHVSCDSIQDPNSEQRINWNHQDICYGVFIPVPSPLNIRNREWEWSCFVLFSVCVYFSN